MQTHVALVRDTQPRVGGRKLQRHLATDHGVVVGRDALFTVLRDADLLVKRKRRGTQTTYSQHTYAVAPNRFAALTITGPRQAVVSDITYLRLARDTFAYLFLVSDVFSRKIVGWHLHRDLSHYGALQALHGDAHLHNVINGPDGPLWNDFEDCFEGPRAWDLGCMHAASRVYGDDPAPAEAAQRGYGAELDAETLDTFLDARRFQGTLWSVVMAREQPERQARADSLLAHYRAGLGRS